MMARLFIARVYLQQGSKKPQAGLLGQGNT